MITVKENKKPTLEIVECIANDPLHKKLNKYELTKFLNCHSCNAFLGKPRSGKTTLLYSFFMNPRLLKTVYHNIYLFQPSHSRASMKKDIFSDLPENKKFSELNEENLGHVISEIKDELACKKYKKLCSCIIFDDCGSYLKSVETILKDCVMNCRHYRISVYFICQTWISMPPETRQLIDNLFIFRCSKQTIETIFEELLEQYNKKDIIKNITKLVYDQPHNYLFVNVENQRLFKNFDEMLIAEE
jgi:hypothetical protein